jgi:serine/threonine protein kinase
MPEKRSMRRVRSWKTYELGEKIGSGAYGKVYASPGGYALKKIVRVSPDETDHMKPESFRAMVENEVKLNHLLNGDGATTPMIEADINDDYAWIVFRRMDGPLSRYHPIDPWDILKKLVSCVAKMHAKNIVHRDVKPQNILVSEAGEDVDVRLCDLGMSRKLEETGGASMPWTDYVTTRWYRAPEIVCGNYKPGQTKAGDMWAVGCVIAGLYLKTPLFPGKSVSDQAARIGLALGIPGCQESFNGARPGSTSWKLQTVMLNAASLSTYESRLSHTIRELPLHVKILIEGLIVYDTGRRWTASQTLDYMASAV